MRALAATFLLLVAVPSAAAGVILSERFVGFGPAHTTSFDLFGCDDDRNVGGACFRLPEADRLRFGLRSDRLVDGVHTHSRYLIGTATWHAADGALLQIGWPCHGGDYPNPEGAAYLVVSITPPGESALHPSCPRDSNGIPSGEITIATYRHGEAPPRP